MTFFYFILAPYEELPREIIYFCTYLTKNNNKVWVIEEFWSWTQLCFLNCTPNDLMTIRFRTQMTAI